MRRFYLLVLLLFLSLCDSTQAAVIHVSPPHVVPPITAVFQVFKESDYERFGIQGVPIDIWVGEDLTKIAFQVPKGTYVVYGILIYATKILEAVSKTVRVEDTPVLTELFFAFEETGELNVQILLEEDLPWYGLLRIAVRNTEEDRVDEQYLHCGLGESREDQVVFFLTPGSYEISAMNFHDFEEQSLGFATIKEGETTSFTILGSLVFPGELKPEEPWKEKETSVKRHQVTFLLLKDGSPLWDNTDVYLQNKAGAFFYLGLEDQMFSGLLEEDDYEVSIHYMGGLPLWVQVPDLRVKGDSPLFFEVDLSLALGSLCISGPKEQLEDATVWLSDTGQDFYGMTYLPANGCLPYVPVGNQWLVVREKTGALLHKEPINIQAQETLLVQVQAVQREQAELRVLVDFLPGVTSPTLPRISLFGYEGYHVLDLNLEQNALGETLFVGKVAPGLYEMLISRNDEAYLEVRSYLYLGDTPLTQKTLTLGLDFFSLQEE